ncbi:MAG TPA: hypothetical protein VNZ58_05225 [Thermomicrobiales bacterium]|nr:hypothetical protein [Thermomicrobiales bacterium]
MTSPDTIACSLGDPELKARLNHLRTGLFARVTAVRQDGDGFLFSFEDTDDTVGNVLEFIRLERECCPFLRFQLTLPPSPQVITVHLSASGDQGLSFVREMFVTLTSQDITT